MGENGGWRRKRTGETEARWSKTDEGTALKCMFRCLSATLVLPRKNLVWQVDHEPRWRTVSRLEASKEIWKIVYSLQTIDDEMQSLESLKQRKLTSKSVVDDKETEINEVRKRLNAQTKEITTYQKAVTALDTKLEQKRADRHSLLKGCKVRSRTCFLFLVLSTK